MLVQRIKLLGLIVVSLFFMLFGIDLLMASYTFNNPFTFVMTFFASNLMILISAVLALGFAIRLKRRHRVEKHRPEKNRRGGEEP